METYAYMISFHTKDAAEVVVLQPVIATVRNRGVRPTFGIVIADIELVLVVGE